MVAGAKYRGDFEDRIKKCLNEVKKSTNIILFIDEIHTIVGAGAAEGAIDAANILKPLLARGDIQLIGATTLNEYRKYIEKDTALERRFQTVLINEPSMEDTVEILKGLRDKYEAHHNVKITDEAIISAVEFSSRYINDRYLPDKAIDLIDEAAAKAKLEQYTEPSNLKKKEEEIQRIESEKEQAIRIQNFEKAAKLRDSEKEKKKELEEEKQKWENENNKVIKNITKEDIGKIISGWTGIPVNKINQTENEKLLNLESDLSKRVIGQEKAINAVAKAIKRARVGLKLPNRPIGSFMFLGPTGVGKTELSKALAENLFGNENAIIRIDMSEYMESHTTSKIIGSPPGYIGYEESGGLTEKVRRKPYSLILFDEIEKAHPEVLNLLLQILDEGRLTDSHGKVIDFKNTVIIMTSNIGARSITEKNILGFKNEPESKNDQYEEIKKQVMQELKKNFRPEFVNRIDDIIVFNKLTQNEIIKIADLMLKDVAKRLKEQEITLEVTDEAKKLIVKKGTDESYGARPLRRTIQTIVEDILADAILRGEISPGNIAKIYEKDGEINLKPEIKLDLHE